MKNHHSNTILLAKQLIECPSVTPEDGGCQEILAHRLEKLGFKIRHLPFGSVKNLWAVHGTESPLLVFAGHTDVVPPGDLNEWETPPFSATIKGDYLYGRGAADMKGSIAAMITAVEQFLKKYPNHPGSIGFLITSDEEGPADNGTQKVMETLDKEGVYIDYCIVGEPSSKELLGDIIKKGRRGSLNCVLKVLGKQGHVAYPLLADNAIHRALLALHELSITEWDKGNDDFPATSFQISNINAGTGAQNVIPGSLECQFNFRFSTAITPEALIARVKDLFKTHHLQYELHHKTSGIPFLTRTGKLLTATTQAIEEMMGHTPIASTTGGTSDGRFIAPRGTEVIEMGPCNASIHCVNEHVKIEELNQLSALFECILEKMYH
jgi:succinyl-diaminopimelate desuccinylase